MARRESRLKARSCWRDGVGSRAGMLVGYDGGGNDVLDGERRLRAANDMRWRRLA